MTNLMSFLPILLRKVDSPEARQQAVFTAWAVCVGKHLRESTSPVKLEGKTLIIAVRDSTWKNQLSRMTGQVLFRLNSLIETSLVTRIEFVINPNLVDQSRREAPSIRFKSPEKQAGPLRESAGLIPDPEMRDAFLRAAGKCLDRRAK